ncbi:MAG: GAF domain-containing protein [Sphingobacteriales bacterium JAD_PAG50586_3]|nr:MAG: GAF domain-containing protein [Sphingobacteriales bacterium JAD_PAG50586_3]
MHCNLGVNEEERMAALRSYNILDTPAEDIFDEITRQGAKMCNVPVCAIALVDEGRVWFKSIVGMDMPEIPRDCGICSDAILQPDGTYEIYNTLAEPNHANNPLVTGPPNIVFYYAVVLATPEGLPLGTLCVVDSKPRTLSSHQKTMLKTLASQAMTFIRIRKKFTINAKATNVFVNKEQSVS